MENNNYKLLDVTVISNLLQSPGNLYLGL